MVESVSAAQLQNVQGIVVDLWSSNCMRGFDFARLTIYEILMMFNNLLHTSILR